MAAPPVEGAKEGTAVQVEKGDRKEGELAELHAMVEALRPTLRPQERMAQKPQESVGMGKIVFG